MKISQGHGENDEESSIKEFRQMLSLNMHE